MFSVTTMAFQAVGCSLLPTVNSQGPARFLCTDSVQLRSMMDRTYIFHSDFFSQLYFCIAFNDILVTIQATAENYSYAFPFSFSSIILIIFRATSSLYLVFYPNVKPFCILCFSCEITCSMHPG